MTGPPDKMRPLILLLSASLLACLSTPSPAQVVKPPGQPGAVSEGSADNSRNYMELFTRLERDWMRAVQEKDQTALETMLAPEFALRTSDNPEDMQPRAEWVQHVLTDRGVHSFGQRAMAIRAFMGVAVVSFVLTERVTVDGKNRSYDYFVIDLWEARHDKWKVCARYIAPAGHHGLSQGSTKARP